MEHNYEMITTIVGGPLHKHYFKADVDGVHYEMMEDAMYVTRDAALTSFIDQIRNLRKELHRRSAGDNMKKRTLLTTEFLEGHTIELWKEEDLETGEGRLEATHRDGTPVLWIRHSPYDNPIKLLRTAVINTLQDIRGNNTHDNR